MQIRHLFENSYTSLSKIWEGNNFGTLYFWLGTHAVDDNQTKLMHTVLGNAVRKHAKSDPLQLYPMLPALAKFYAHTQSHQMQTSISGLINDVVAETLKLGGVALETMMAKVDAKKLEPVVSRQNFMALKLEQNRHKRTPEEEDYDDATDLFVFVARPAFKKVGKSSSYKKTLEIENMVKVDRFDAKAHQMVGMMKMRARFQGENSEVYMVHLPKGTMKGGQPSDKLLSFIDKNKTPVTH